MQTLYSDTSFKLFQVFKLFQSLLFKEVIYCSRIVCLALLDLFLQAKASVNPRMAPSKNKVARPKEVSLESPPKDELPKVVLPKDENNLFHEDDDIGTFTLPE